MAVVRIGGSGAPNLPVTGLISNASPSGTPPFTAGYYTGNTNALSLGAGEIYNLPSGTYQIKTGPYTFLQYKDPVVGVWYVRPTAKDEAVFVNSDGSNYRLANTTGCVIGAVITTATCTGATNGIGSAVNLVSCVASTGGSVWNTIVGGAISATIATATTTAGTSVGSNYTYPPIVVIDAPPAGGLQATAIVTSLSNGTVIGANIQIINQGAGYSVAPNMNFLNDPRDTTGTGAIYVTTLTATGQLTGLYPTNHGTAQTAVPTLSFALTNGGSVSCAATAIMNFTVTAYTSGVTVGSSIGGFEVVSVGNVAAAQASPAVLNPLHTTGLTFPRPARIAGVVAAGVIATTGQVVEDGGLGIQVVPSPGIIYTVTSTTAVVPQLGTTLTVGGTTDTSYIQQI